MDKETGKYRCRFCGKLSVPPKRYYCSDECYWNCQRSVAWWFARRGTFKRDGGKCVKCGGSLNFDNTWDCHHIIPVKELWGTAWDVVFANPDWDNVSEEDKARGFATIYTLLVHDINNLITLCSKCHKEEHAATKTPIIETYPSITLDDFFKTLTLGVEKPK